MSRPDLYKVLGLGGRAVNGGESVWNLPDGEAPADWTEHSGPLEAAASGLHLATRHTLVDWIGPCIYPAHFEGDHLITDSGDYLVRRARLLPKLPNWGPAALEEFAKRCYAHVEASIEGSVVEERLTAAYEAGAWSFVVKLAVEVHSQNPLEERAWQSQLLHQLMGW